LIAIKDRLLLKCNGKIRKTYGLAGKRSYDDGCASAHALELIGERWALLVVRELMLGPKRFSDLKADLRTISPNVLAQRLEELEAASIVERRRLPPPAASWVYELTAWGRELEPVLRTLGRWAARSPAMPEGKPMSTASVVLAMRTMFDPGAAAGRAMRLALRIGHASYRATIANGALEIEPEDRPGAVDAAVETDADTLDALVFGGRDLEAATRAGAVTVTGDATAFARFVTLFPLPEPAAARRR
jgi:DNA-binding HxlR family transcriptional regulator